MQATRYRQPEGAADFAPEGQRGSGAGNAVRFLGVPFADYMRRADVWPLDPAGEIFNLLLIENGEGVKNIAEIDRTKVERDIQTIVDACKAVKMICGITADAAGGWRYDETSGPSAARDRHSSSNRSRVTKDFCVPTPIVESAA